MTMGTGVAGGHGTSQGSSRRRRSSPPAALPVVARVMLFMTVSSVITGARLDGVQQALGSLSENLERVRHLMEAGDYARLESAAEYLDEGRLSYLTAVRRWAPVCSSSPPPSASASVVARNV